MKKPYFIVGLLLLVLLAPTALIPPYTEYSTVRQTHEWGQVEHRFTLHLNKENSGYASLYAGTRIWVQSKNGKICKAENISYSLSDNQETQPDNFGAFDACQYHDRDCSSAKARQIEDDISLFYFWRSEGITVSPLEIEAKILTGDRCVYPNETITVTATVEPRKKRYTFWGILKDILMSV